MMTKSQFDEIYGESVWNVPEREALEALEARRLWTQVEGDSGAMYLLAGYHRVNAIQYVRTANPWPHVDVLAVAL